MERWRERGDNIRHIMLKTKRLYRQPSVNSLKIIIKSIHSKCKDQAIKNY